MPNITIIGSTSWGITLGTILAQKKLLVKLWTRTEQEAIQLNNGKFNPEKLPDIDLPPKLSFTNSISEAVADTKAIIMVVPSQTMRQNIRTVRDSLTKSTLVISAAKGLEIGSNKRMSEVIAEEIDPRFHSNICVLSGPNLAREVLLNLPAATVIAAADEATTRIAQRLLTTPKLCVFTNTDVVGIELGGALKNIIALGAGIADGLGYGDNAKAAFMTRGLTEISALGVALGANPLTFSGLAGLGDVIATCTSPLSRNHYVGEELARGRPLDEILNSMSTVAEGVPTTAAAWQLAQKLGIEMPITEKIYQVLYQGLDLREAAVSLMTARVQHELTGRKWKLFSLFRHKKSRA